MSKRKILATLCSVFSICVIMTFPGNAATNFDPNYYASTYPDVAAIYGTDPQALLEHYFSYGRNEGRLPYAGAEPGAMVDEMKETTNDGDNIFKPVPLNQLANLTSIQKKASDEELAQAYNIALEIVKPYANINREDQLLGIALSLRELFDSGIGYSMETPHYNDPYGYFVLRTASCAGSTRATGLCLNILGIPYEHVNENQYSHQWCRINVNGTYWICDPFGLYCGPEPAPYAHPYL